MPHKFIVIFKYSYLLTFKHASKVALCKQDAKTKKHTKGKHRDETNRRSFSNNHKQSGTNPRKNFWMNVTLAQSNKEWNETIPSHENIIYACFGGLSNTGITAALASLEAVKELGLAKVSIGCLAGISTKVPSVIGKTKVANKVITVDGCPMQCSKKVVEEAGFAIDKSIVLVRDIGMKKKALHEDIGKDLKPVMQYISEEDVKKAKEIIIKSVLGEE